VLRAGGRKRREALGVRIYGRMCQDDSKISQGKGVGYHYIRWLNFGTLEHWNTGTLEHWKKGLMLFPMLPAPCPQLIPLPLDIIISSSHFL
jgi:hypothetical protein